jgi:hypothetical protein
MRDPVRPPAGVVRPLPRPLSRSKAAGEGATRFVAMRSALARRASSSMHLREHGITRRPEGDPRGCTPLLQLRCGRGHGGEGGLPSRVPPSPAALPTWSRPPLRHPAEFQALEAPRRFSSVTAFFGCCNWRSRPPRSAADAGGVRRARRPGTARRTAGRIVLLLDENPGRSAGSVVTGRDHVGGGGRAWGWGPTRRSHARRREFERASPDHRVQEALEHNLRCALRHRP